MSQLILAFREVDALVCEERLQLDVGGGRLV